MTERKRPAREEKPATFLTPVKATPADVPKVWSVISSCAEWLAGQGMTHWRKHYNASLIDKKIKEQDVYLISQGTIPVATITLGTHPSDYYVKNEEGKNHMQNFSHPEKQALYVTALAVKPEYQQHGLAKKLMQFAEEEARKRGVSAVRFDARGDYQKLIEFYLKLGYKQVGVIPDTDSDYFLFEKEIN